MKRCINCKSIIWFRKDMFRFKIGDDYEKYPLCSHCAIHFCNIILKYKTICVENLEKESDWLAAQVTKKDHELCQYRPPIELVLHDKSAWREAAKIACNTIQAAL